MSTITNPLPNTGGAAFAVYREELAYGPIAEAGETGMPGAGFHDVHRWVVDAAADAAYGKVQAVFDGDLYISGVINEDAPDEDKLVWLALAADVLTGEPLSAALAGYGITRTPAFAFYGNVRFAGLADAMADLGHAGDLLLRFTELSAVGNQAFVLPVAAGDVIGELGDVVLADGSTARALDFKLAMGADGWDPLYPDGFYEQVRRLAGERFLHGSERDPALSIWSVSEPRVIVWCNDEWNHPLGQYREADLSLVRDDGSVWEWESSAIALAAWANGFTSATLQAQPAGDPAAAPLLLSRVPSAVAAATSLEISLDAPAEIVVQALDPHDWFPPPGGRGWDAAAGAHTDITLAAPHALARYTAGNTVTPLIDGNAYFSDLALELDRVTADSHWVCQAGWWLDHDFPLAQVFDPDLHPPRPTGDDARPLVDHWQRIASTGASIHALVWDPVGGPHTLLSDALADGGVRDLWYSIDDWDEAARAFAVALVNTEMLGGIYNPNAAAVAALNAVTGPGVTEAILDGRHRPGASHHAKMCAVRNSEGLVAWVGGIDLNTNRVNTPGHHDYEAGAGPYHDVQCRIEGPAARDVLRTFLSRWNDHPPLPGLPSEWNAKTADLNCDALGFAGGTRGLTLGPADDRTGGTDLVQIGRTFGNCRGLVGAKIFHGGEFADDGGYGFAPDGEFTIESAILGAIKRAKKFIYIEDQFLGNLKVATAVADKIAERKAAVAADPANEEPFFVYVVVPYSPTKVTDLGMKMHLANALAEYERWMDEPSTPSLAGQVIDLLGKQDKAPDTVTMGDPWGYLHTRWHNLLHSVDPGNECWQMYCLRLPPYKRLTREYLLISPRTAELADRRVYIHTKVVIVDDVWATIGSANMAVRSYTSDTEINASFIDGRTDDRGLRVSVRDLRRALWAEHLDLRLENFPTAAGNDPSVIALWAQRASLSGGLPETATGHRPIGSRAYLWPDELRVDSGDPPVMTWSRHGNSLVLEPFGITELPQYWWIVEGYGKAPWAPDAALLMPPPIGSDRFKLDDDDEDGSGYLGLDLVPHAE